MDKFVVIAAVNGFGVFLGMSIAWLILAFTQ